MKRRTFLKTFVGAIATVAIGLRMAHGMPKIDFRRLSDPDVVAVKVRFTDRFEYQFVDWRAMYGSPGVVGIYEQS